MGKPSHAALDVLYFKKTLLETLSDFTWQVESIVIKNLNELNILLYYDTILLKLTHPRKNISTL